MDQSKNNLVYKKTIGAFRPNFQGKPQTYYTLTNFDVCCSLFACFSVVLMTFGVSIGLYFWSQQISTSSLITAWSVILLVFIPFFMITAFYFSKGKAEVEQKLIKEALQRQMHKKQEKENEVGKGVVRDEFGFQNRDVTSYTVLKK